MGRKIGSKNKLKQTQKQSQVVNVNITQEKKVKRKPRNKKPKKEPPILYDVGQPSLGRPSDNSLYTRPPIIAQVIPQIGKESQSILPPTDTGIENVLANIRNKTDKIAERGKSKILSDTGSKEILNIEPKKKRGLIDTETTEMLNIKPKVKELKDVGTQPTKPETKPMVDTGSTDVFNIEPKVKDIKDIGTEPAKKILSDTGNEIIFETQKQKEPKLLKFDKEKISDVKTREMFRKQNKESIDKYKNMVPSNDFQRDKVFAQREPLPINPFPIYKEESKKRVKQILEKAPEPSNSMSEIMTRKVIVPKYTDISGNKERIAKLEERIKKQKEDGIRVTKSLSDIGDISNRQLFGSKHPLNIESNVVSLKSENKKEKKKLKKESLKAFMELDKLQNELIMKKRQKEDEIKTKRR